MKEIFPPTIAILGIVAVYLGYISFHPNPSDGLLLGAVVASISGLGGFMTKWGFDRFTNNQK